MGVITPAPAAGSAFEAPILVKRVDPVPVAVAMSVIGVLSLGLLAVWLIIVYKRRPSARTGSAMSMVTTVLPSGTRNQDDISTTITTADSAAAAANAARAATPGGSRPLAKSMTHDSDTFSLHVHERLVRDVYRYPSSSTSTLLTTAELQDKVSMRGGSSYDVASTVASYSAASRSLLTLDTRAATARDNSGAEESNMPSAVTQSSRDTHLLKQ